MADQNEIDKYGFQYLRSGAADSDTTDESETPEVKSKAITEADSGKSLAKGLGKDALEYVAGAGEVALNAATLGGAGAAGAAGKTAASTAGKTAASTAGKAAATEAGKTAATQAGKTAATETGKAGAQSAASEAAKDAGKDALSEAASSIAQPRAQTPSAKIDAPKSSSAKPSDAAPDKSDIQKKIEQTKKRIDQADQATGNKDKSQIDDLFNDPNKSRNQARKDHAKEKQSQSWSDDHRGAVEKALDGVQAKTGLDTKEAVGKVPLGLGRAGEAQMNIDEKLQRKVTKRRKRFLQKRKRAFVFIASAIAAVMVFTLMGSLSTTPDPANLTASGANGENCLPTGGVNDGTGDFKNYSADQVSHIKDVIGTAKGFFPTDNGYSEKDQKQAARIGLITMLVETEVRNMANSNVPQSLEIEHDAVGADHDSVGIMQQRPSQEWGDIPGSSWSGGDRVAVLKRLMNPVWSASAFYNRLQNVGDWETRTPGVVAQTIQGSAFPDKYQVRVAEADAMITAFWDKAETLSIPKPFSPANPDDSDGDPVDDEWEDSGCPGTGEIGSDVSPDGWANPHPSGIVTSPFGPRGVIDPGGSNLHTGTDISDSVQICGAKLYVANDGIVTFSGKEFWGAWMLTVDHGEGVTTSYAHMQQKPNVDVGQKVQAGQYFGTEGTTGFSFGCHLHFELKVDGTPINAEPFLEERGITLGENKNG